MPEQRSLPLLHLARKDACANTSAAPGVALAIIHPLALVTVIARKAKARFVRDALGKLRGAKVMDAGADQWFVQGCEARDVKAKLGASASVIDQSHGRVAIRVSGPMARMVLAKGTPVDLHPAVFPVGRSAMTSMAHVGVHLTRTGDDAFTLLVFRGFSESFWEWLVTSSAAYGYTVTPSQDG